MCSSLGLSCLELSCTSWTWLTVSFPMLGKFSTIIPSNILGGPFSLSSPSGTPIIQMLVLAQWSLKFYSFFFHSIFYILFCVSDFHHSRSLIHSSISVNLLLIPSSALFMLVCSLVLDLCKHFLHLLHSFIEILDHLHCHYSEFFFWKVAYLHFI